MVARNLNLKKESLAVQDGGVQVLMWLLVGVLNRAKNWPKRRNLSPLPIVAQERNFAECVMNTNSEMLHHPMTGPFISMETILAITISLLDVKKDRLAVQDSGVLVLMLPLVEVLNSAKNWPKKGNLLHFSEQRI